MSIRSIRILAYVPRYYALPVQNVCKLVFHAQEIYESIWGDFEARAGVQIKYIDLVSGDPDEEINKLLKIKYHTHILFSKEYSGLSQDEFDDSIFTLVFEYQDLVLLALKEPNTWPLGEEEKYLDFGFGHTPDLDDAGSGSSVDVHDVAPLALGTPLDLKKKKTSAHPSLSSQIQT